MPIGNKESLVTSATTIGASLGETLSPMYVVEATLRLLSKKFGRGRGDAAQKAAPALDALALSPLTARAVTPVQLAPVFAPYGARLPTKSAAPLPLGAYAPCRKAWSRCRVTRAGRPTHSSGVSRPYGAPTGGAAPPPCTGAGAPENAGAFSTWRPPRPSVRPAWAGATSGAAPRKRLAS